MTIAIFTRYVTCMGLGVVTALAMAPYGFWPALLCFGGVVWLVGRASSAWQAAAFSAVYAFGYFAFGLYWVQNALGVTMGDMPWLRPIALLGLPLILAPFWAVAGYVAGRLWQTGAKRAWAFVGLVALVEYLRAVLFTGFPWNYFAYAWGAAELPAAQFSGLVGVYTLNAMTLVFAGMVGLMAFGRKTALVIGVMAALVPNAYGVWRIMGAHDDVRSDIGVVIVQPNIVQAEKWDDDKMYDHFARHVALSEQGLAGMDGVDSVIVLWPETAIDDFQLAKDGRMLADLQRFLGQERPFTMRLVSGILRGHGGAYYNSIASLGAPEGNIAAFGIYDKRHLVPFGEYIPLVEPFGITPVTGFSGFAAGTGDGFIRDPALPPAIGQICYEAIFPHNMPRDTADAQWIVNVSNDGWYGDTSGPYQHLVMSRYRSIESGLPMLRSTTTGISAIIDGYGRIIDSIPYGVDGVITGRLPQTATSVHTPPFFREALFFGLLALWGLALRPYLR